MFSVIASGSIVIMYWLLSAVTTTEQYPYTTAPFSMIAFITILVVPTPVAVMTPL